MDTTRPSPAPSAAVPASPAWIPIAEALRRAFGPLPSGPLRPPGRPQ